MTKAVLSPALQSRVDAMQGFGLNGKIPVLDDSCRVYLRHSIYADAVREVCGCDVSDVEVIPRFAFQDPLLEQLVVLAIMRV